jgi:hypothetical protein
VRIIAENKCLFKYVNGTSGSIKATSQVIHIINTELQVSPLHCAFDRQATLPFSYYKVFWKRNTCLEIFAVHSDL